MNKIKRNWLGEIEDDFSELFRSTGTTIYDIMDEDELEEYVSWYDDPADDYIYDPYKDSPL